VKLQRCFLFRAISVVILLSPVFSTNADDKTTLKTKAERPPIQLTERAKRLHKQCLVIHGHNDLPWALRENAGLSFDRIDLSKSQTQFHTDLPRLRAGGVGAQFWSAFVPAGLRFRHRAVQATMAQIDLIHRMVKRYPEHFEMVQTADDIEKIHAKGKIASMIGIEGGHSIDNSLGLLRYYYTQGVRYMTLTHSDTLDWADSATDKPKSNGLSPFGEEVVRTMNELGMLVDISHVSVATMKDSLRISKAPVIASHSSAYAIAKHPRNIPDDVLKLVKKNGGVIMVNFFSGFVVPESAKVTSHFLEARREMRKKYPNENDFDKAWSQWRAQHKMKQGTIHHALDHIVKVAGVDHVGLGSDFDGVSMLPKRLQDVSTYPYITQGLLDRGYSEEDIKKIMGENLIRALKEAERVAAEIRKTADSSE